MNIKLKAMLYTAAYIAGFVLLGYLVTTFPWYTMAFFCMHICVCDDRICVLHSARNFKRRY
jgi:hypothetical protein